jgi:hypothetical protein
MGKEVAHRIVQFVEMASVGVLGTLGWQGITSGMR